MFEVMVKKLPDIAFFQLWKPLSGKKRENWLISVMYSAEQHSSFKMRGQPTSCDKNSGHSAIFARNS